MLNLNIFQNVRFKQVIYQYCSTRTGDNLIVLQYSIVYESY